jgi:hypothetical protein
VSRIVLLHRERALLDLDLAELHGVDQTVEKSGLPKYQPLPRRLCLSVDKGET